MADYIRSNVSTISGVNAELLKVQGAIASKVDEYGGGLTGDLNANGQRILNLPEPVSASEPLLLGTGKAIQQAAANSATQAAASATAAASSASSAAQSAALAAQYDDEGQLAAALALPDSSVLVGGIPAKSIANRLHGILTPEDFMAVGNDSTDDSIPVLNWLTALAANPKIVGVANGVYLIDNIGLNVPNGLTLSGLGVFKALGSTRLNMISLVNVQGDVCIDGPTFDGNNLVARPFEIKNLGNTKSPCVYIGKRTQFIRAKNVAPLSHNASGFRCQGKFNHVVFEGTVDGVDNTLTTGAVSVGAWFDWSGGDYIKNVVVTCLAKIKNVKNDNTVLADADGIQRMGPTDQNLSFTVQAGSYFENCKGRSIKSQVTMNSINSPVIVRNLYDGIVEIDCQYSGGYCAGAQVFYDGVTVEKVISAATRLNLASNFTMRDNVVTVKNQVSPIGHAFFFWGTDQTNQITQDSIQCDGNKVVGGSVNHVVTVYAANQVNTNKAIIKNNWADSVVVSYLSTQVVYDNPSQLTVTFDGNGSKAPCVGATVVSGGVLRVDSFKSNKNISSFPADPEIISNGVLTLYAGSYILVGTEGGAGFDDVSNIASFNYATGDEVKFRQWVGTQKPTFKHGVGNIRLAGGVDFELGGLNSILILTYDSNSGTWAEVSRSSIP